MRRFMPIAVAFLSLACLASAMPASQTPPPPTPDSKASSHTVAPTNHNAPRTGEEVFKANCGRCHMPPSSISPRITGTVVMHMRTRARLSREDEQLLLKFLAP